MALITYAAPPLLSSHGHLISVISAPAGRLISSRAASRAFRPSRRYTWHDDRRRREARAARSPPRTRALLRALNLPACAGGSSSASPRRQQRSGALAQLARSRGGGRQRACCRLAALAGARRELGGGRGRRRATMTRGEARAAGQDAYGRRALGRAISYGPCRWRASCSRARARLDGGLAPGAPRARRARHLYCPILPRPRRLHFACTCCPASCGASCRPTISPLKESRAAAAHKLRARHTCVLARQQLQDISAHMPRAGASTHVLP